jgi:hypothetical protein
MCILKTTLYHIIYIYLFKKKNYPHIIKKKSGVQKEGGYTGFGLRAVEKICNFMFSHILAVNL